ncbi:hypothetical protein GCM10010397_82840 [Streptomyces spinoverrucosus]|nr:hypothetical protein GCM10010397_82840 [Streptomyces spinoverrucosus]
MKTATPSCAGRAAASARIRETTASTGVVNSSNCVMGAGSQPWADPGADEPDASPERGNGAAARGGVPYAYDLASS